MDNVNAYLQVSNDDMYYIHDILNKNKEQFNEILKNIKPENIQNDMEKIKDAIKSKIVVCEQINDDNQNTINTLFNNIFDSMSYTHLESIINTKPSYPYGNVNKHVEAQDNNAKEKIKEFNNAKVGGNGKNIQKTKMQKGGGILNIFSNCSPIFNKVAPQPQPRLKSLTKSSDLFDYQLSTLVPQPKCPGEIYKIGEYGCKKFPNKFGTCFAESIAYILLFEGVFRCESHIKCFDKFPYTNDCAIASRNLNYQFESFQYYPTTDVNQHTYSSFLFWISEIHKEHFRNDIKKYTKDTKDIEKYGGVLLSTHVQDTILNVFGMGVYHEMVFNNKFVNKYVEYISAGKFVNPIDKQVHKQLNFSTDKQYVLLPILFDQPTFTYIQSTTNTKYELISFMLSNYKRDNVLYGHAMYIQKKYNDLYSYEVKRVSQMNTVQSQGDIGILQEVIPPITDFEKYENYDFTNELLNHKNAKDLETISKNMGFNIHKGARLLMYRKCNYTVGDIPSITLLQIAENIAYMKPHQNIIRIFSDKTNYENYKNDKNDSLVFIKMHIEYTNANTLEIYTNKETKSTIDVRNEQPDDSIEQGKKIQLIENALKNALGTHINKQNMICIGSVLNVNAKEFCKLDLPVKGGARTIKRNHVVRKMYITNGQKYIIFNKCKIDVKRIKYTYVDRCRNLIQVNKTQLN